MVKDYSTQAVTWLLSEYIAIRTRLTEPGSKGEPSTIFQATPSAIPVSKRPFGFTPTGPSWPFLESKRAASVRDGKKTARSNEQLVISLIDIEAALRHTPDEDLELLYKYYVFGTRTLDELCREQGVPDAATMLRRCERAVARLTERLNTEHVYRKEVAPFRS